MKHSTCRPPLPLNYLISSYFGVCNSTLESGTGASLIVLLVHWILSYVGRYIGINTEKNTIFWRAGKAQPQKKNDVVELARLSSSVDSKDLLLYGKQHIIISFIDF